MMFMWWIKIKSRNALSLFWYILSPEISAPHEHLTAYLAIGSTLTIRCWWEADMVSEIPT